MPLHAKFYYVAWTHTSTNRLICLVSYRHQQKFTKHLVNLIVKSPNEKESNIQVKKILLDIIPEDAYNKVILMGGKKFSIDNPLVTIKTDKTNPILRSLNKEIAVLAKKVNSEIYKQTTTNRDWNNELNYYKNRR